MIGSFRRLHADERGVSLVEILVGVIISAMVMSVLATSIFTVNDLRKRADDRSQFAGDLSIASLSFDRDSAMATATAPAKAQAASVACSTQIDLGFQEGGASVRYRTVASGSSGPLWLERVSGSGTRTIIRNMSSCTWRAIQIGSGRQTILVTMTLIGTSGETITQILRSAPRMW